MPASTLADIHAEGRKLRVFCSRCDQMRGPEGRWLPGRGAVVVDPAEVGAKLGMDTPIDLLRRKLRCKVCGSSGKRGTVFVMPEQKPLEPMGASRPGWKPTVW